MKYISLFSGVGGGDLGLQHLLGWNCIGYVEYEKYPVKILEQRIKDGLLSDAPIYFGDINEWIKQGYAGAYKGLVDVIAGGFPCQPFSVAGRQAASDDPRNQWPATIRAIRIIRPRFTFLENVPGLLAGSHGYFGTILSELAESGYDAVWKVLSAAELGAPHKRDRLWILAYTKSNGPIYRQYEVNTAKRWEQTQPGLTAGCQEMANSNGRRREKRFSKVGKDKNIDKSSNEISNSARERFKGERVSIKYKKKYTAIRCLCSNVPDSRKQRKDKRREWSARKTNEAQRIGANNGRRKSVNVSRQWWKVEPKLGRVAHGVANRVDRLKAIGNGQVPAVAAKAWEILITEVIR